MLDFFLEAGDDYMTFVGIGTIIAAFVGIAGLIITIKQNRDSSYLQFVSETDKELAEHLEKGDKLNDKENQLDPCLTYSYNYVDICERVMFLLKNRKIPQDFFDYYYDFLNYGLTMMWWYTSMYKMDRRLAKTWPLMTGWVLNNDLWWIKDKINAIPDPYPLEHIPTIMIDLFKEQYKETNDTTSIPKQNDLKIILESLQNTR